MATLIPAEKGTAYIVRKPRATDGVGRALRGVFGDPPGVPDDMTRILRLMDRVAG